MEVLYQYVWKHRLLGRSMKLISGESVEVLSPGRLNTDAGPDFSDARLRINGTEWIGNVEIHVKASDWFRHHHDTDRAYDNVILHVVAINDMAVKRSDGSEIPTVEALFPEAFFNIYLSLSENINGINCAGRLSDISDLAKEDWLESLAVERMHAKADRINGIADALGGDRESACFIALARALGFGLNGEPFEMLARSIPLKFIVRHSDNLLQIEALLFGQAGFLDTSIHIFDEYYQLLCREYFFLARKYSLRPLRRDIWKYARTRPGNFPHRRIAFLASMLYGGFSLFSRILETDADAEKARLFFSGRLEGYWETHSDFDIEGPRCGEALSRTSIDSLLINLVAPLIFASHGARGDYEKAELAFDLWQNLKAENNAVTRQWSALGLTPQNAMRSQALLQLRKEYCDASRCLDCRFGHALLRKASRETETTETIP